MEAPEGCLFDDPQSADGRRSELEKHHKRQVTRALERERFQRLKMASADFDPSPLPAVFQFNAYCELVKATGFEDEHMYVRCSLSGRE